MLAQVGGEDGRLAANSLASAQVWLATIIGPAVAGLLLARTAPAWLLGFDAATFAFLGTQAWRAPTDTPTSEHPVDARAPSPATASSAERPAQLADLIFSNKMETRLARPRGWTRSRLRCTSPIARI